jgi:phage terminase large subunit-like protein
MIIAVNIGKTLAEGKSEIQATERAWDLAINNCRKHDFVIGVVKGEIKCCFNLLDVVPDMIMTKRVAFQLEPCSPEKEQIIKDFILKNNINLKGIQRGKYI